MGQSTSSVPVVYVMGSARSGSTVLDTVLGNHKTIESVGELSRLPYEGWRMNRLCACGQPADSCVFWSRVHDEWLRRTNFADLDQYFYAVSKLSRVRRKFNIFEPPDRDSRDFAIFSNVTSTIFQSIRDISGKPVVLDSSKDPFRAFLLTFVPGVDLKLIHLVRDARGVAGSFQNALSKDSGKGIETDMKKCPVWKSSINWLRINLQANALCRQLDESSSIRIQYEELIQRPRRVLTRIGKLLNIDLGELSDAVEKGEDMKVGHTIAGNRLRMNGVVKLHLDEEWRGGLSAIDRQLAWLITGSLMRKYEYGR